MKKGKSFILLACVFFLCVFVLFNQRKVQPDKTYSIVNNNQMLISLDVVTNGNDMLAMIN